MDVKQLRGRIRLVSLRAPKFQQALAHLVEASAYAQQTNGDLWDYAVEINRFRQLGLSDNDLRFLVRMGLLDHACEVTAIGKNGRQFRRTGDLSFVERTCFVLTAQGLDGILRGVHRRRNQSMSAHLAVRLEIAAPLRRTESVPVWDAECRTLLFDGKVVKRFRWQAANQELVLATFQEESWPMRILDPLAPQPAQDRKRRLSDTIKCLNRGQLHELLHFRGDGTGEGVIWERATDGVLGNQSIAERSGA